MLAAAQPGAGWELATGCDGVSAERLFYKLDEDQADAAAHPVVDHLRPARLVMAWLVGPTAWPHRAERLVRYGVARAEAAAIRTTLRLVDVRLGVRFRRRAGAGHRT